MEQFNVGDKVDVFVAEYFFCVSPTELQPMYTSFDGQEQEVPGGTGWIPGTIVEIDTENINRYGVKTTLYSIDYDELLGRSEGVWVPIEYIRRRGNA